MGRREKMQTRTITVDYARPRGYDVGYRAENNFTELSLPVPAELEGADSYRVYFESTVGEYLQTELLTPTDGYVTVKITSDIVPEPGNMAAQLVAFADGEIVGYAPVITGTAKVSIPDGTERLSHSLAAEIALNTAARHSHDNKFVLDKFAESKDGKPTYDGKALGDGSEKEIFKILVTITELEDPADGESFKVEHTMTLAELDAAAKEGKTLSVLADRGGVTYNLPLFYYVSGAYCFYAMAGSTAMYVVVGQSGDEGETPKEVWQYIEDDDAIDSKYITYYNRDNTSLNTAQKALDKLLTDSHTHDNKAVLDLISTADGKLKYNGSDVSLKPVYYIDLAGTYPNYTCPVAMDDIKAAYNAGYNLVCRCTLGGYTATLPLFVPMPAANTWIFSGSGALQSMGFPAQSFTIAITSNGVSAQQTMLARADGTLPNPYEFQITVGNTPYLYDGSERVNVVIDGITPTIGANGNWYLGTTDTGKPSRGEKGKTPVKGTDYWTAADKAEIVKDTLAALPKWTGGSY